ncbi:MAG: hypothetical protein KF889_06090 [Alphaproteobacteria bacterium]|nr:hypothetical protein [Alphaproteobacteria bacterium]MCW5740387.1 hypothetical protein [Alphaproteobacteria bacterium]
MARNHVITPDFWTWEAVIDCAMPTRLLFIGLWHYADSYGVQPLRPRAIRMQVFPGDEIADDTVRAMIEELAARGLVRIYEVEGLEYFAIVDWAIHQRIGKRARRRYPRDPSLPEPVPPPESAPAPVPMDAAEHAPPASPADLPPDLAVADPPPDSSVVPSVVEAPRLAPIAQPERWRRMIKNLLRQYWPGHPLIELMDDETADRWTAKWIAQGCDFKRDIVPVVRDYCALKPFIGPPVGFQELDEHVAQSRALHEGRIVLCRAEAPLP